MKPTESKTNATRSSQPPPPRQKTVAITIDDDSVTESESEQGNSTIESEPNDYHSAHHLSPPENQLGLEEWEHQCRRRLRNIPEVPEPTGESQPFEGIVQH